MPCARPPAPSRTRRSRGDLESVLAKLGAAMRPGWKVTAVARGRVSTCGAHRASELTARKSHGANIASYEAAPWLSPHRTDSALTTHCQMWLHARRPALTRHLRD